MESSALKMSDQLRRQGMEYPDILKRIRDVYNVSPPIPSRTSIPSWTGDTGETSIEDMVAQDIEQISGSI